MKNELTEYIFRDGTYTFAVLDGASIKDLPLRLYELSPRFECLYRGELSDEMIHVAPYLVHLEKDSMFCNWLFTECWGKHWGIFVQSPVSMAGTRKHLRSILVVNDEFGNPLLFRYYDPRVLEPFLITCTLPELTKIFGPIKYLFAESFDHAELCRMHIANDALVQTKLSFGGNNKAA